MQVEDIARAAHEVNWAYCLALGDTSQVAWDEAPAWQRDSAITGVRYHLLHPDAQPADSHESWLRHKRAEGWTYGPVRDAAAKTHPCFLPYEQLPAEQKAKDHIYRAVVRSLIPHLQRPAKPAEPLAGTRLVVVGVRTSIGVAQFVFPGWDVVPIGNALTGCRYDTIVITGHPQSQRDWDWLGELRARLNPDGRLEWLT